MRSILIITLSFVSVGNAQFLACNLADLADRQKTFNNDLQIDPSITWNKYDQLRSAVEAIYGNMKTSGLVSVCRAFKNLKMSFLTANYQACAENPVALLLDQNLQPTNYTRAEAEGYVKYIAQFDFACGAGFGIFANQDACMGNVFVSNTTKLRFCDTVFNAQVNMDPSNACVYTADVADCYRTVFKVCGMSAGWWGCEYERISTGVHYPQCTQNFCTAP